MLNLLLPFLIDPAPAEPAPMDGAPPMDPNAPPEPAPAPPAKPGLMNQPPADPENPDDPPKPPAEPAAPAQPGVRPEYLPEQFWDEESKLPKVESLAKSYADLRNEFNKFNKDGGKPLDKAEDYLKDFTVPTKGLPAKEGEEGKPLDRFGEINTDDPAIKAVAKGAHLAKISKAQFDVFLPVVMEALNEHLPEPLDVAAEMSKLGDTGPALVKANVDWVNALRANGVLNEDQHALLFEFGSTALGVELCNALRVNSGEKPIPVNASVNTGAKTPEECYAMQADPRYSQDGPVGEAYRAEVEKEFTRTFGTGRQ